MGAASRRLAVDHHWVNINMKWVALGARASPTAYNKMRYEGARSRCRGVARYASNNGICKLSACKKSFYTPAGEDACAPNYTAWPLFPLNSCRRFIGNVIDDAVYALYFVCYSHRGFSKQIV